MHCALCRLSVAPRTCDGGRRHLLLVDGYVAGGEGERVRKGVRVEMTGRIERNGDARKRKKKCRWIERVTVNRRMTTMARNSEDGEQCMRARMDCSIVKYTNTVLKKSAIVSLMHSVVSRHSRRTSEKFPTVSFHGLHEALRGLLSFLSNTYFANTRNF